VIVFYSINLYYGRKPIDKAYSRVKDRGHTIEIPTPFAYTYSWLYRAYTY